MVSINVEIPESLFDQLAAYISEHQSETPDNFLAGAIACALMQNGVVDKTVTNIYVEARCKAIEGTLVR